LVVGKRHCRFLIIPAQPELILSNEEGLKKSGNGSAVSLQLIGRRETALPCPLYYSGAAGIDIIK